MKSTASFLSSILFILCPLMACTDVAKYNAINGYLCINANFTVTVWSTTKFSCASQCTAKANCQAFTIADGPCQLFVFHKCSKYVRDCACTRRGQVFVKERPGLQPGALCPSGYGDDLCGVKYRFNGNMVSWQQQEAVCQAEFVKSDLVIMSDVTDSAEMSHVDGFYAEYSSTIFWLGGFQVPGSPEPAGGWYWVSCNTTVASNLWGSGEPNNSGGTENAVARGSAHGMLTDSVDSSARGGVCECLSPFD